MKPLNHLVLISKNYQPTVCGVGDFTFFLAGEFSTCGVQCLVVSQAENGELWKLTSVTGTPIGESSSLVDLAALATKEMGATPVIYWQYVPYSFQKKGLPWQLPRIMQTLSGRGFRQAVFFHEVAQRKSGYGIKQWLIALQQQTIAQRILKSAYAAATSIQLFSAYFFPPIPVIPVGSNLPATENPRNKIGAGLELFCFTNRCQPWLLQAIKGAVLAGTEKPIRLHVAGSSDAQRVKALKEWQQENDCGFEICLHGFLPSQQLSQLLASCHLMLQPQPLYHRAEGGVSAKNGTIAAAMAASLPFISTRGDMTDPAIFQHATNCWLVHDNAISTWQEAIITLGKYESFRLQLGNAARATYERFLTWPVITRQHKSLLETG